MKRSKRTTVPHRPRRRQPMPYPATAHETTRTVRLTDRGRSYVAWMQRRDSVTS